jgi:predicted nucleic acid-binding protein
MTAPVRSALIDTSVLLDYLAGDRRAQRVLDAWDHRSISVVTWLQVLAVCPPDVLEATRGFLRTFERLSISEAIADEALRLMLPRPTLPFDRALTWATANVNQIAYVTVDPEHIAKDDANVTMPYRWTPTSGAQASARPRPPRPRRRP